MFLDSTDKSFNTVKFCRNNQREWKKKEKQRERPCYGIRFKFTKCTVWPHNDVLWKSDPLEKTLDPSLIMLQGASDRVPFSKLCFFESIESINLKFHVSRENEWIVTKWIWNCLPGVNFGPDPGISKWAPRKFYLKNFTRVGFVRFYTLASCKPLFRDKKDQGWKNRCFWRLKKIDLDLIYLTVKDEIISVKILFSYLFSKL